MNHRNVSIKINNNEYVRIHNNFIRSLANVGYRCYFYAKEFFPFYRLRRKHTIRNASNEIIVLCYLQAFNANTIPITISKCGQLKYAIITKDENKLVEPGLGSFGVAHPRAQVKPVPAQVAMLMT